MGFSQMMPWCHPLFAGLRRRPGWSLCVLGLLPLLILGAHKGDLHLQAWFHYRAAGDALERRDFAQAQTHLAASLKVWPNHAASHFLAARAARRAGDLDLA